LFCLMADMPDLPKNGFALRFENHHNNNDPDRFQRNGSVSTAKVDESQNKNRYFSY